MKKENIKEDILKGVQKLLNQQTDVILSAVDEKISSVRVDMINLETRMIKRMEVMEERWNQKFDKLTTTLDNFLKRMTDIETEFTMMGNDINRIKRVIKEKLGVEL